MVSPAFKSRVRKDNWENFSVLRHGSFDGFLVTSKNSGTHWLKYMISIALADSHGIERPEFFSENAVRPYIGSPKDKPSFAQLPRLAFSHTIPHRLADWKWARNMAKLPPYVLAVRHPMGILASHFAKWNYQTETDWLTYLKGDPSGKSFRCDVYWIARFWNRWGKLRNEDPDRFLTVHYEDTLADTRAIIERVAQHWQLELTEDAVDAALAEGTKSAMAERIDPQGEPNVLQNRQETASDLFVGDALKIYTEHIETLFEHSLGYDLIKHPD